MERPTEIHLMAVKRIMRYVKGTYNSGVKYTRQNRSRQCELIGFTDSDYAGDVDDRRSTTGYVFMIGCAAVSWCSRKQPVVTLSTTEAEFIAACAGGCQAVWLRRITAAMGETQNEATVIYCDNSSTIKLSKNPILHGRSKHIDIRFHFLRDLCKEKTIDLRYCSTDDQVADVMTKPLKVDSFNKLKRLLGMTVLEN